MGITTSQTQAFAPEQIEVMQAAFNQTCEALGIADCADPRREIVAKRIIELAQTGVRTRSALYFLAVMALRPNSTFTNADRSA